MKKIVNNLVGTVITSATVGAVSLSGTIYAHAKEIAQAGDIYSDSLSEGYMSATDLVLGAALIGVTVAIVYALFKTDLLNNLIRKAEKLDEVMNKDIMDDTPEKERLDSSELSNIVPKDYTDKINAFIRRDDPDFSGEKFSEWAKGVFVNVCTALSQMDTEKLSTLENEEMVSRHKKLLQDYFDKGQRYFCSDITVNQAYVNLYRRKGSTEKLTVYISGVYKSYAVDKLTRSVAQGQSDNKKMMKYLLTFSRPVGTKTRLYNGLTVLRCEKCGAQATDPDIKICPYCRSAVSFNEHNWILNDIYKMIDDTPISNGGVIIE